MPEIWDLYDSNKVKTGEVIERKRVHEIPQGLYHLAVDIWVKTSDGRYLITQRSEKKPSYPLYWECTGGAVVSGEDSIDGAVRETKEETGITITPQNMYFAGRIKKKNKFIDIFFVKEDFDIGKCVLQEDEVDELKLVSVEEMIDIEKNIRKRSEEYMSIICRTIKDLGIVL